MQDECGDLINRNYPVLGISLAYAKQGLRPKLLALYGLLATVEESLYRASDPVVSNAKLTWWYEELKQAKRGVGNHPLSLQLQSSGALGAWPESLIERLFTLAMGRVEAEGVSNEKDLQQLCESLGLIHLELEAALQNTSAPEHKMIMHLATCNGLIQLFRESYKASQPTYYWVPLSDCARSGIERRELAENPPGTKVGQVFNSITDRTIRQEEMLSNAALLTELPRVWSGHCRHWLLFSLLQRRQLLHMRRNLAKSGFHYDIKKSLQNVRLSDGWSAWRAARRLNAAGKADKDLKA